MSEKTELISAEKWRKKWRELSLECGDVTKDFDDWIRRIQANQREVDADEVEKIAKGIRDSYPDVANFTFYDKAMIDRVERAAAAIRGKEE